jgi:hypothetical protein
MLIKLLLPRGIARASGAVPVRDFLCSTAAGG